MEDEAEEKGMDTRVCRDRESLFSFFTLRLLAAIVVSFPARKTCPNGP